MEDDKMEYWRWCDRLSVVEAAMLAAGVDPAVFEVVGNPLAGDGSFHKIGASRAADNDIRLPVFVAVFRALRRAILAGDLPAVFGYSMRIIPDASFYDPSPWDEKREGENHLPSCLIVRAVQQLAPDGFIDDDAEILFQQEPDWRETTVGVDDLRTWMERRGRRPAFFFSRDGAADRDGFMDTDHDHYSPELALAVKAWRALAATQKTPGGVRAMIERWITDHPEEWGPLDCRGTDPKARIATVANWNKSGGASRT